MRGLEKIPTTEDLQEAYEALITEKTAILPEKIALWTQWCRFDPRLAEILVEFLIQHWEQLPLIVLRKHLLAQPWPQAFGVLAENAIASGSIPSEYRRTFRKWTATILTDVPPAPFEQFFIGLRKIAGREMMKDVFETSQTYLKWGYFGRDLLVNKASRAKPHTLVSSENRRRLLHELMQGRSRITVKDYQTALEHRVSKRQAELDLSREKRLRPFGNTRGRFYRVK